MNAAELFKEILFTRLKSRIFLLGLTLFSTLFGLMGPYFQKEFLDSTLHQKVFLPPALTRLPPTVLEMTLLGLSFLALLASLGMNQAVYWLGMKESLILQKSIGERIYTHLLKLRSESLSGRPIGEIVSIYTTDLPGATILLEQSLPQFFGILFPLILAPLFMGILFQIPVKMTAILIVALIALNLTLAFRQSRFFFLFKKLAGDRIAMVAEWVQNIRALRILGWTEFFENKIFEIRKVETKNRIGMLNNGQTMNAISSSVTFFLNVSFLSSLVFLAEQKPTVGQLLALLWVVALFLTKPFRQMPWFFTFVFDAWTSIDRLAGVLSLKNLEVEKKPSQKSGTPNDYVVQNLNFNLLGKKLLEEVSFRFPAGSKVGIVGEVGSGKSLLLLSLMAETSASFQSHTLQGEDLLLLSPEVLRQKFSYVPQESFIMSSSLRDNIEFQYDSSLEVDPMITRSLLASQFNLAKENVPGGLNTEIGERGVNLSGGQKQRISLARADYHPRPVILLDDSLSALDVVTEEKIIQNLFQDQWKNQTLLLVTHRLSLLPKLDHLIFMEKGKVQDQGTFESLYERNPKFKLFTASLEKKATPGALPP